MVNYQVLRKKFGIHVAANIYLLDSKIRDVVLFNRCYDVVFCQKDLMDVLGYDYVYLNNRHGLFVSRNEIILDSSSDVGNYLSYPFHTNNITEQEVIIELIAVKDKDEIIIFSMITEVGKYSLISHYIKNIYSSLSNSTEFKDVRFKLNVNTREDKQLNMKVIYICIYLVIFFFFIYLNK